MCRLQLLRRSQLHRYEKVLQGTFKFRCLVLFRRVQQNRSRSVVCHRSASAHNPIRHQIKEKNLQLRRVRYRFGAFLRHQHYHEPWLRRQVLIAR
jgi:hypothetical protein